jgi:hypothetical protein
MRKNIASFLLAVSVVVLNSCLKDKVTHTYTMFSPVYKTKAEVYANIKNNPSQQIQSPGKLFLYGNYIFLNEVDKGVHIIDNTNPASPVAKAFIEIPGNLDIAVKGNILYADLNTDLVVIDISNPLAVKFEKFIPFVFPYRNYTNGFMGDSTRVIVDWIKKDTTVDINSYRNLRGRSDMLMLSSSAQGAGPTRKSSGVPGMAGSMARFSIADDYMYCVNNFQLRSFSISNPLNPQQVATNNIPASIETIYPLRDKLFIGSTTGMFIYDITNPALPVKTGQFTHARACDPVIADGDYAYVTLHDGTQCMGFSNQLDVINISNLSAPVLTRTYPLTHPHGLSKDDNLLFLCDGRDGLKMYNATNPANLILQKHITGLETYDAIAWNNNLVVVAKDGLYQYDYSVPGTLVQRSKVAIINK